MNNKSTIRIFSEPETLSIIDRAKYIVNKHYLISERLNKFDWFLFDRTPVDLNKRSNVEQLILKRIKKNVTDDVLIKNVPDDYVDTASTIDGFYASKKLDGDASFRYDIGVINKYNTMSSLVINNFHFLNGLDNVSDLKQFISFLTEVFKPSSIQVTESSFYRAFMDLKSDEYWFGWMTYFSKEIKLPPLPNDIEVEELPNGGKLLITTQDFFSSENPEHVKKAKYLVELFRKNNIRI